MQKGGKRTERLKRNETAAYSRKESIALIFSPLYGLREEKSQNQNPKSGLWVFFGPTRVWGLGEGVRETREHQWWVVVTLEERVRG